MLTDLGCDMYQGYLFSRPIPVKDFEKKYFMNGGKTCMDNRNVV
jgi:EAL domain-containing protein (putative c-di-GMP-specific phosphodiesterase class I)